jgi:hypothetical protein
MRIREALFCAVLVLCHARMAVAQTYTGCNGSPATGLLQFWIVSMDWDAGFVEINGVDVRGPSTPFTWIWGDGSQTDGWFGQSHVYPNTELSVLQVISHEDDGSSDCAQLLIFASMHVFDPISDGPYNDLVTRDGYIRTSLLDSLIPDLPPRVGAVTDGTTLLLLQVPTSTDVTFSVNPGDGVLLATNAHVTDPNAGVLSLPVHPQGSGSIPNAWAVFRSPAQFGQPVPMPRHILITSSDPRSDVA